MGYTLGDIIIVNGKKYILTQNPDGLKDYYGPENVEDGEWGVLPKDIDIAKKGLVEDIIHEDSFDEVVETIELD